MRLARRPIAIVPHLVQGCKLVATDRHAKIYYAAAMSEPWEGRFPRGPRRIAAGESLRLTLLALGARSSLKGAPGD